MSLDLNKLANKLDEALSNETSETLTKFLNNKKINMNQEFCIDRFPELVKTSIKFYIWSLNKLMIQYETKEMTLIEYSDAHQELIKKAEEMYRDEIEAAAIISSAEQSTSAASADTEAFAIGYEQGYNRALELSKWAISNLVPSHNEKK